MDMAAYIIGVLMAAFGATYCFKNSARFRRNSYEHFPWRRWAVLGVGWVFVGLWILVMAVMKKFLA